MMNRLSIILILFLIIAWDCSDAQIISDRYAIQNVKSDKNLRPYEAISSDGNKIVLYDHVEWKCMTWEFIQSGENTFQLKNRFTSKTFQPSVDNVQVGTGLVQQPLRKGDNKQIWEFIETTKGVFNIRLKGTEFYISQEDASAKTNSPIILTRLNNSENQKWKLVKQDPVN